MKDKLTSLVSINDLKDLEYGEDTLTPKQRLAIRNFERYRYKILTSIRSEEKFHAEFQRLQAMANLTNYDEFLKEEYC